MLALTPYPADIFLAGVALGFAIGYLFSRVLRTEREEELDRFAGRLAALGRTLDDPNPPSLRKGQTFGRGSTSIVPPAKPDLDRSRPFDWQLDGNHS